MKTALGPLAILAPPQDQFMQTDVIIPKDQYFVIGENPAGSYDSRHYGPVPAESIKGRLVFRHLPINRLGVLR